MKKIIDIKKGDKFGSLKTISEGYIKIVGKNTSRYFFDVQCDCGKEFKTTASYLRSGKIHRCVGCAMIDREKNRNYVSELEQLYNHRIVLRAKVSNIENNLNLEEYSKLVIKDCFYCGAKPIESSKFNRSKYIKKNPIKINGLDRIDSTKEYSKENCIPCCKNCNTMKMDISFEEFLNNIKSIYKNLNLEHDDLV